MVCTRKQILLLKSMTLRPKQTNSQAASLVCATFSVDVSAGFHIGHTSSLSVVGVLKFFFSNLLSMKENDAIQNTDVFIGYFQTEASYP
jgi:hypothetical protein